MYSRTKKCNESFFQGASAAVINVATAIAEASRVSPSQLSLQSEQGHEATGEQGEPVAKRPRTVVLDLASLVKEAVFDTQQVQKLTALESF